MILLIGMIEDEVNNMTSEEYHNQYEKKVSSFSDNYLRVFVPEEKIRRIKSFIQTISQHKSTETQYIIDGKHKLKRFETGLLGEAALEEVLGINIIEWSIGNSTIYDHPDIKEYGIGVKTVERNKFPVIRKTNNYPQIICIKSDKVDNLLFICGLATVDVLNAFQDDRYILDDNLRNKGTKTCFFGFEQLKRFKNKEELENLL